ncbi:hypothetical protein FHT44_005191 [Mycolicibacterium sp. BK634]|nr:hypothetical protein [Mycolicibacterium sp. BK634]
MKWFYQCRLTQGESEMVGWIEARGAVVGCSVEVLPSGEWWTVAEVHEHKLREDQLRETQRLNRHSLPSVKAMA